MSTTYTPAAASTTLAAAAVSSRKDLRPWFTYERISKTRSGKLRSGDGRGGLVGEDAQHGENVAYVHGWDPEAQIVDWRDNASGWDPKVWRPDWETMLEAIGRGECQGVVAWHADRFTRQPMQLEQLIAACLRGNVQLHTRLGGFHQDPTMIRIEGALSWKESKQKSDRQKLKQGTLAMEGKPHGGSRAYGWNQARTQLVDEEAAHIRWAAQQVLAGSSLRSITAELAERGATTATGVPWRSSNLGTYLRRPMLAGLRVSHGQVVGEATWPALLDLGTWEAVRNLLESPERRVSKSAPRVYLLSGIARCGSCGGAMRGRSGAYRDLGPAYFCENQQSRCAYRRADLVDAQVRAAVVERLAQVNAYGDLVPAVDTSERARVQGAIDELEGRQIAAARLHMRGQITEAQLSAGTVEAEAELTRLRRQLADLETDARRPAAVLRGLAGEADAAAIYDAMDLEGRRSVVALLATVTIHAGARGRQYDPSLVVVDFLT